VIVGRLLYVCSLHFSLMTIHSLRLGVVISSSVRCLSFLMPSSYTASSDVALLGTSISRGKVNVLRSNIEVGSRNGP